MDEDDSEIEFIGEFTHNELAMEPAEVGPLPERPAKLNHSVLGKGGLFDRGGDGGTRALKVTSPRKLEAARNGGEAGGPERNSVGGNVGQGDAQKVFSKGWGVGESKKVGKAWGVVGQPKGSAEGKESDPGVKAGVVAWLASGGEEFKVFDFGIAKEDTRYERSVTSEGKKKRGRPRKHCPVAGGVPGPKGKGFVGVLEDVNLESGGSLKGPQEGTLLGLLGIPVPATGEAAKGPGADAPAKRKRGRLKKTSQGNGALIDDPAKRLKTEEEALPAQGEATALTAGRGAEEIGGGSVPAGRGTVPADRGGATTGRGVGRGGRGSRGGVTAGKGGGQGSRVGMTSGRGIGRGSRGGMTTGRGGRSRATSETGSQLFVSMVQGSAEDSEALGDPKEAQAVGKWKADDPNDWSKDLPLSALRKVPKRSGTPSKESKKELDPVPERSSAQSKESDIVKREGPEGASGQAGSCGKPASLLEAVGKKVKDSDSKSGSEERSPPGASIGGFMSAKKGRTHGQCSDTGTESSKGGDGEGRK
jgi:hypothetical protein